MEVKLVRAMGDDFRPASRWRCVVCRYDFVPSEIQGRVKITEIKTDLKIELATARLSKGCPGCSKQKR